MAKTRPLTLPATVRRAVSDNPMTPVEEQNLLRALLVTRPTHNLELFLGAPNLFVPEAAGMGLVLPQGRRLDPDFPFRTDVARLSLAALNPTTSKTQALQLPSLGAKHPESAGSDNSNTQFAVLALLAAARHGVPVERSLALAVRHFRSQRSPLDQLDSGECLPEGPDFLPIDRARRRVPG